jgi:hypothetical protein
LFGPPASMVWHCAHLVLKRVAPFFAEPFSYGAGIVMLCECVDRERERKKEERKEGTDRNSRRRKDQYRRRKAAGGPKQCYKQLSATCAYFAL